MAITCYALRRGEPSLLRPNVEDLPRLLEDPDIHAWIDLDGSGPDEQRVLSEVFKLHPLLVEDILQESQPKLEDYGDHLYVIVHGIDASRQNPLDLGTLEIDIVLGQRFLLTHHDGTLRSIRDVRVQLDRDPELLVKGVAFVAHSILDHLTDHYAPLMDRFDQHVDDLEVEIMKNARPELVERIFDLKHSLQKLRRIGLHQKDVLLRLARGGNKVIPETAVPFYRDIHDHFVRVSDLADSYRDIVSAALEAYLSMQSQKLNEVMKFLTLMSTIMLPLTFIAGVYGMNFELMPELRWRYGYPFALVLMGGVVVLLVWYFKKRRFL